MKKRSAEKIIIYSHGFGVRQDACGIFTALAAALPQLQHVMFDYNTIVSGHPDIVLPLPQQAEMLLHKIATVRSVYPAAELHLVGHSQGCVAIALANPEDIKSVLFIAPTIVLDAARTIKRVGSRPGSVVDVSGVSRVVRSDGSINMIPAAHWAALSELQPLENCAVLTAKTRVTALLAEEDKILAPPDLMRSIPNITVKVLSGDHDFTGASRTSMIEEAKKVLHEA